MLQAKLDNLKMWLCKERLLLFQRQVLNIIINIMVMVVEPKTITVVISSSKLLKWEGHSCLMFIWWWCLIQITIRIIIMLLMISIKIFRCLSGLLIIRNTGLIHNWILDIKQKNVAQSNLYLQNKLYQMESLVKSLLRIELYTGTSGFVTWWTNNKTLSKNKASNFQPTKTNLSLK